jgi:hypothetical protein
MAIEEQEKGAGAIYKMVNASPVSTHSKTLIVTCLQLSSLANLPSTVSATATCMPSYIHNRLLQTKKPIAKLRGHGLIAKVKEARLYRITKLGSQVLFAVLSFYQTDFLTAFQNAQ